MKDKEKLLSFDNPVRFIFSHSALREGWDNPNVFQICTLKHGGSSPVQKRQEVGRGLRLCVNQSGDRMDLESWNGAAPKYDIREWAPEHERMGKGVTLTEEEARKLYEVLGKALGM